MYIPESFKINGKNKFSKFIEQNNFADLVTFQNGSINSNKAPLFFDEEKNLLYGHFSRANPQLKNLEDSPEVLVIFSGPNTYISPQWYESENMVPTWNFQTIQVRGIASIVDDYYLLEILRKLSIFHESQLKTKWSIDHLDTEKLNAMLKLISGFKIEIKDIKFKEKMSQNRTINDQQSVIRELNMLNQQPAKEVANIMTNNLKSTSINS